MAKRLINLQSGQTLVEAIFVVAIVGLILSGLVTSVIYANRVARASRDKSLAVKLAREKMEDLRDQKISDPTTFWDNAASGIGGSEPTDLGSAGSFDVSWEFDNYDDSFPNTRRVRAIVTVNWQDGAQTKQTKISSYFTQY